MGRNQFINTNFTKLITRISKPTYKVAWGLVIEKSSQVPQFCLEIITLWTAHAHKRASTCVPARETGSYASACACMAWYGMGLRPRPRIHGCCNFATISATSQLGWSADEESFLFAVFVNGHRKMGILSRNSRPPRPEYYMSKESTPIPRTNSISSITYLALYSGNLRKIE